MSRIAANDGRDFRNREISAGDSVIKVTFSSNYPAMEYKTVTRVVGNNVYLDFAHSPVKYSGRLIVVTP